MHNPTIHPITSTITPAIFPTHKRPGGIAQQEDDDDDDDDDDGDDADADEDDAADDDTGDGSDDDDELLDTTQSIADTTTTSETTEEPIASELDSERETLDLDSTSYDADDEGGEQSESEAGERSESNPHIPLRRLTTDPANPRTPEEDDTTINNTTDHCRCVLGSLNLTTLFFMWLTTNFLASLAYWGFRRFWRYKIEPRVAHCLNPHGEDERGLSRPRGWWFQQQQQYGFSMETRRPKPKMKRRPSSQPSSRVTRSMTLSGFEARQTEDNIVRPSTSEMTPPPSPGTVRLHRDIFYGHPELIDAGAYGNTPRVTDSSDTE